MGFSLDQYLNEKKKRQPGQLSTETTTTPTGSRASGGGGFSLDGYIQERGIRTGQLQKQDKDFNAWLGDMGSFSSRMSSDYNRRKTTYQSPDAFRAYQEKTGTEIADLLQRAKAAKRYYAQYGKVYDETRGKGSAAKLLEGIDQNIGYLEGMQKGLQSEGEWWGQFLDQSDFDAYQQTLRGMEASRGEKWTFTPMTQSALETNKERDLQALPEQLNEMYGTAKTEYEAQKERVKKLESSIQKLEHDYNPRRDSGGYDAGVEASLKKMRSDLKSARGDLAAAKQMENEIRIRYYSAENQRAFQEMEHDAEATTEYNNIKTIESDREKLLAVAQYTKDQIGDGSQIAQYRDQLEKKYGIDGSVYDEYATGSSQKLMDIYNEWTQKIKDGKQRLDGKSYNFDRMSKYEERAKRQAEQAKQEAVIEQEVTKDPGAAVLYSGVSTILSPFQVLDYLGTDWGSGDPDDLKNYVPPDTSKMNVTSFVNSTRGAVSKQIEANTNWEIFGQNVASFVYQTGMSVADSAFLTATLGPGSTYFMGMSAAVSGTKDVIQRGGTREQAILGGIANGVAEYLFERVSIENLLKPKNITGWKSLLKETFKQGGIEASEEMFTEIANILSDAAIMGANSNFATAVTNYMKDGLSREKAEQKAYLDCIAQVNWAGVGGFLSGVAMGGTKGAYEFGQYSKAQQNLEVVTRELQDVQKRRSHEAEGDGVDRSASEQTAADIFSGLPSNASEGTIDNIKTSRGGTEHGESRKESKVDFQRRSHSEGYSVYERGQNSFGYRRAQGQFASQNARQVQKELKTLGIDADIIVGSILRNRDGVTLGLDVSQAATLNAERIFINSDANLPPRNIAGHEAFHFWKSKAGRSAYIQAIEDNLLFKSEAFLEYQAIIAEAYLGEDVDLNDQRQIDALFEELFAYISGDIHEGVNDELLRPMFRDYEAVKRAWQDFVELQRGDNIVNTDVVETLVSSNGDGTLNSVVEIGGRFLQGPDAPSDRVALMNQAAQSGFGPMGQPALTTIYDRDMAAEIDPARAHLAFSQGYNAVIQGRKLPALPGGIPADIPPGLHGLYRLAQEMATKPQPREIPQRPVQQSPQEILSQLAWKMARDSLQGGALDSLSNEDIRAMLEEIAAGNEGLQSDTGDGILTSGAISGALNPEGKRARKHAVTYYGLVRKMTTDVARIAKNTGYSKEQIQRIKNFLFVDEHDLGGGKVARFDPSYEIAQSWQRLLDGKEIQPHDLTLLMHEILESELMGKGHTQDEAHRIASKKYDYRREAEEYYGQAEEYS